MVRVHGVRWRLPALHLVAVCTASWYGGGHPGGRRFNVEGEPIGRVRWGVAGGPGRVLVVSAFIELPGSVGNGSPRCLSYCKED